jgi:hypothetical protein
MSGPDIAFSFRCSRCPIGTSTGEIEIAMAFGKTFDRVAPILMGDLIEELGLTENQAAGFVGNFGHESGLVSGQQEGKPIGVTAPIRGSKGGIDWAQWTASRRTDFANFVEANNLPYPTYRTSLDFVEHELRGKEKAALAKVRQTRTLTGAVQAVQDNYERQGVKATPSRIAHAERALALYRASTPPVGPVEEVTVATLQRDLAALSQTVADLAVEVAKLRQEQA